MLNEDNSPTIITFLKGGVVKCGEVAEIVEPAEIVEVALIGDAICQPEGYKIFLTELTEAQRI